MDEHKWEMTGHSMTKLNGTIRHIECVYRTVEDKNENRLGQRLESLECLTQQFRSNEDP